MTTETVLYTWYKSSYVSQNDNIYGHHGEELYGGKDPKTGDRKSQREHKDENVVHGEYSFYEAHKLLSNTFEQNEIKT